MTLKKTRAAVAFLVVAAAGVFLTEARHIDWAVRHPAPPGVRQRFERMETRIHGDAGIVDGVVVSTTPGRRESRGVFTDVFVRRGARRQAVNAQENVVAPPPTGGRR